MTRRLAILKIMTHTNDTITAQATPPGRGGIAIVRVSGAKVIDIMQAMLGRILIPREATYLPFLDANAETIDEGIALYFSNPHSFTGEDVLELQGHGGPVVVDLILQRLLSLGARLARPGEFSERAFLNDKLDLTQAEAIADLIDASSRQAARLAMRSLQGDFSKAIHLLTEKIIQLRMFVEAAIDFTDEEIDFLSDDKISNSIQDIIHQLSAIQANAKQGSFLREGITAVIAGEPNVGKSSLLNCLSGKEVAIVTDIPGTTRDVLRDYVLIDGMPMHIIDTAGLRESEDIVEQEGIRRAHQEIEKADIVLHVISADQPKQMNYTFPNQKIITVRNKIDLYNETPAITEANDQLIISISAKNELGIDLLKQQIKTMVGYENQLEGTYLARRRHLDALARAKAFMQAAFMQLTESRSAELVAEDLRLAQLAMNDITGEFTSDDLLGEIFSHFCIGK